MAFFTIRCSCKHVGLAVLPSMACCSKCGAVKYYRTRDGRRIVAPDLDTLVDVTLAADVVPVVEQQPRGRGRPRKATATA
jgi:hypothetical protein